MQGHAHAVRRRTAMRPRPVAAPVHGDPPTQRDRVAAATTLDVRGDDVHLRLGQLRRYARECAQAGGVEAVVVGDEDDQKAPRS